MAGTKKTSKKTSKKQTTNFADDLGAHVSSAGGADLSPSRAHEVGARVFQIFTKQPSRWHEPEVSAETAAAFAAARVEYDIRCAVAHDSYLINLSSPDATLWERSYQCFVGELRRSTALGLEYVVTHPGNATDGDLASGLVRNAEAVTRALEEVPGKTMVLLELTAGTGKTVGASFEQLAALREQIAKAQRPRVGVCFDTCHAFAVGYDLVNDYDGVWRAFDDVLGLDLLRLFHLNDSQHPLGSRRDRHADIGEGTLGDEPFRRIVCDERFAGVAKVIETPKGSGEQAAIDDRRNLDRLRSYCS